MIDPYAIAQKYGYSQSTFANDPNFQSYWQGKTETQFLQGLGARTDWSQHLVGNLRRITDENVLAHYTEEQIIRDPNSPNIYLRPGIVEWGGGEGLAGYISPEDEDISPDEGAVSIADITAGRSTWGEYFSSLFSSTTNSINEGIMQYLSQQQRETEEEKGEQEREYETSLIGLEEAYKMESGETLLTRLMEKHKLQEKIDKLTELQSQLVQLEGDYNVAKVQIEAKPIHAAIIRGQKALKYREYAARASVIGAQVAITKEQFNMTRDIVKDYYNAASTERLNEIQRYTTLLEIASNNIIRLDEKEKTYIDNMVALLREKETKELAERDKKMSLIMSAAELGIDFTATGISFDDDLETLFGKIVPMMATEQERRFGIGRGGVGRGIDTTTVMGKDVDELARQAIELETSLAGKPQAQRDKAFSVLVEQLAEAHFKGDYDIAQTMLIQQIQRLHGEPVTYGFGGQFPEEGETDIERETLTPYEWGEEYKSAMPYWGESFWETIAPTKEEWKRAISPFTKIREFGRGFLGF